MTLQQELTVDSKAAVTREQRRCLRTKSRLPYISEK
jgi:hypothetical protein